MDYYDDIVSKRSSCRSFASTKVGDDVLVELRRYHEDEESDLVDEIETELSFYYGNVYDELSKSVGYNGFCIKAPAYMVLFSEVADHYLENAGFIAQGLTLKMTELGLAACWLTVNDPDAAKAALHEDTDKTVACVVAFGYRDPRDDAKKAPKMNADDLTDGKKFGQDMPVDYLYSDLEDGLRAMARAQSFLNKQPYRVIVDDDMISLVGLPDEETGHNDRCLNYGIVMFNFYAVMSSVRASAPRWSFDAPGRDLGLPEGVEYIAKCGL